MTDFSYTINNEAPRPVGHLAGDIDLAAVEALEAAIGAVEGASEEDGDVVLDMSEVTFLDSSGLRVLVTAHERYNEAGARFVIKDPSAPVVRILEITGLLASMHIEA
jgi:anti-anti-sigma factor